MTDKPVTVIISDLHVAGGPNDPGDGHYVYDANQFVRFLHSLRADNPEQEGHIELIINGDFLEFGQVRPEVYALASALYWCSESESLQALEAIIQGHADFFEALKKFQETGNRVTLAAGNHDVDLYWPESRIVSGCRRPLLFELGHATYTRYGGRLLIGHGHMYDPANRFDHCISILPNPPATIFLKTRPGTLFMTKFVNWLEADIPCDNIKPVTALGRVLWREVEVGPLNRSRGCSFGSPARHPIASLEHLKSRPTSAASFARRSIWSLPFRRRWSRSIAKCTSVMRLATVRQAIDSDEGVWGFIRDLIGKVSPERLLPVFDRTVPETLAIGDGETETLAILSSGIKDEKQLLRETARGFFLEGREVVVFGQTHQPGR